MDELELTSENKFWKKITLLLFLCFLSHIFLSLFYIFYKQNAMLIYCSVTCIIDFLLFIASIKINNPIIEPIFFSVELIQINIYTILFSYINRVCSGAEFFPVALIFGVFYFSHNIKKPQLYYIFTLIPTFLVGIMIPVFFNNIFEAQLNQPSDFYLIHKTFSGILVFIVLILLSLQNEYELRNMIDKTKIRGHELYYIASHDFLTGLTNRRRFWDYLRIAQAQKETQNIDYAFSIFDIDNFKRINDVYGHDCGDIILKNVASIVKEMKAPSVKAGRWGGEEFVLFFPTLSDDVFVFVEELRQRISDTTFYYHDKEIKLSMTFGVSSSKNFSTVEDIIVDADFCLMEGKERGKNIVIISPQA